MGFDVFDIKCGLGRVECILNNTHIPLKDKMAIKYLPDQDTVVIYKMGYSTAIDVRKYTNVPDLCYKVMGEAITISKIAEKSA